MLASLLIKPYLIPCLVKSRGGMRSKTLEVKTELLKKQREEPLEQQLVLPGRVLRSD